MGPAHRRIQVRATTVALVEELRVESDLAEVAARVNWRDVLA